MTKVTVEQHLDGGERLIMAAQPALHQRQLYRQRRELLLDRLLPDVVFKQILPTCMSENALLSVWILQAASGSTQALCSEAKSQ